MTWALRFDPERLSLHAKGRISQEDALRQERTADAIFGRFRDQPGVVLADEVGMGKTFVALAVAASVAWADRQARPVVVMVPPSLREKWPRDFDVFLNLCVRWPADRRTLRAESARDAAEFFGLIDDPRSLRANIIFLSHGAFHRSLRDPWIRLALLKEALRSPSLTAQRRAMPRFAAGLLRARSRRFDEDMLGRLLSMPCSRWGGELAHWGPDWTAGAAPVPAAVVRVLDRGDLDLAELREELRHTPLRHSMLLEDRLSSTGGALAKVFRSVWREALAQTSFRSPLLILDEAHHLKNPATRLASLFVEDDSGEDQKLLSGALANRFERLLFLTATPFQLGHRELLNVLSRFGGITWRKHGPRMTQEAFAQQLKELTAVLDDAQQAATALDSKWRLLRPAELGVPADDPEALEQWWAETIRRRVHAPERVQAVLRAYDHAQERLREAQERLRPWVIRHRRRPYLGAGGVARRQRLAGRRILLQPELTRGGGLPVTDKAMLPFLLAARTEALELRTTEDGQAHRLTFAEGLASSYEAFLQTRAVARSGAAGPETVIEEARTSSREGASSMELSWYLRRLNRALPGPTAYRHHPKIEPTVARALAQWREGEKVLIFCHYRATGRALQRHVSDAMRENVLELAVERSGLAPARALAQMISISNRFDKDEVLDRELTAWLRGRLPGDFADDQRDATRDVLRRFLRTPTFLARYFPLADRDVVEAFRGALRQRDGSGLSLSRKVDAFIQFLNESCLTEEREEYLGALRHIHTGGWGKGGRLARRQQAVRLANGETDGKERRKLLLGFNTPFFPEILIASSVMAEGVDLHRDCRHVIHHDLTWNPSTLEQRTGRVDRIGAKAEQVKRSIQVYLPYVAGTQDEKMYRVVCDRERWFQVLMGEDYRVEESYGGTAEDRLPLPEAAANGLSLRLEI